MTYVGLEVRVSWLLPADPPLLEVITRVVRHGLADALRQCGETVGPAPEDKVEALLFYDVEFMRDYLLVSPALYEVMSTSTASESEQRRFLRTLGVPTWAP